MIDPYVAFCFVMVISGTKTDPINVTMNKEGNLVAALPDKLFFADGDSLDSVEFQMNGCPGQADRHKIVPAESK